MFVLDTNVLSEIPRPEPDANVAAWLVSQPKQQIFTNFINQAEILFGIALLPPCLRGETLEAAIDGIFGEDFGGRIIAFSADCSSHYADIAVGRKLLGRPISQFDAMIAAVTRAHGARLVTRNTADFEHCDIEVVNPWRQL